MRNFIFLFLSAWLSLTSIGNAVDTELLAPNDVSILLRAPLEADDRALALPETAFSTSRALEAKQIVDAAGKVLDPIAGSGFSVGTELFTTDGRKTWRVASIRIDPGAPGLTPAFAPFGRQLQIRLVVQPAPENGGSITVRDEALHLIYSFADRVENESCPLRRAPSPEQVETFGNALADLRTIKDKLASMGVVTDGKPLGLHPAFEDPAAADVLMDGLEAFLHEHLSEARLSALSIAGIPADAPEPWIFFAMNVGQDGRLSPVPGPAIAQPEATDRANDGSNMVPAQAISFLDGLSEGRVMPEGRGRNALPVDCLANLFPIPQPGPSDSVSTSTLFPDAANSLEAAEAVAAVVNDPAASHFFNTDCVSCHTETRRSLDAGADATELAAKAGLDESALPRNPAGNPSFDRWNVRAFGWFPGFSPSPTTRAQATAVRRTAAETEEVLACFNEGDWADTTRPCLGIDRAAELDQGWDSQIRDRFYHTSQGGDLLPLAYFLALETADGKHRFADPENLAKYGWLASGMGAAELNRFDLPVGLAVSDEGIGQRVSLNCAACHTGDVIAGEERLRIEGAPAALNFDLFLADLAAALRRTVQFSDLRTVPPTPTPEFKRFLTRVFVFGGIKDPEAQKEATIAAVSFAQEFAGRAALRRPLHPSGPGRVDALTQIVNAITVKDLGLPENHATPMAPTSYPPLWLTPRLEFVQYNLTVSDPLNRNLGQALGVFGSTKLTGTPGDLFESQVDIVALDQYEDWVADLRAPEWPATALGEGHEIKPTLAEEGRDLFKTTCADCHNAFPYLQSEPKDNAQGDVYIKVTATPYKEAGTDALYTEVLTQRWVDTGVLGTPISPVIVGNDKLTNDVLTTAIESHIGGAGVDPTTIERLTGELLACFKASGGATCPHLDPAQTQPLFPAKVLPAGLVLAKIVQGTTQRKLGEVGFGKEKLRQRPKDHKDCTEQDGKPCGYAVPGGGAALKAGPLEAVWATGPYLHNGSVRTIYELLSEPIDRAVTFWVGSRKLDPENLGFEDDPDALGAELFDTSIPGNGNGGHVFWSEPLTHNQKMAIIEYLKDPRQFPIIR